MDIIYLLYAVYTFTFTLYLLLFLYSLEYIIIVIIIITLKFLEIKNISRERFKSLVYGGVCRFCRTCSIFFSNVRL